MSLTKSDAQSNWRDTTFVYTPTGANAPVTVTIREVESVQINTKGKRLTFEGDAAPGPTKQKIVNRERMITVTAAEIFDFSGIEAGVEGTLTTTFEDFENGNSTGAIDYTITNCMLNPENVQGKHADVGKATGEFSARWVYDSGNGVYIDPVSKVRRA